MQCAAAGGASNAQQACPNGIRIEGTVTDPSGAAILGARVQASSDEEALSSATGDFRFACIPGSSVPLHVEANGFTAMTITQPGKWEAQRGFRRSWQSQLSRQTFR